MAVLEKGWVGGGNTARNTTIVRSNYLLDDSAFLYEHSLKLWEGLTAELDFNVMFSQRRVVICPSKLNPVKDSLILESPQSQYTCEIVVRKKDADQPWVKKLVAAYQSPVVKKFIQTTFNGAAVPCW